MKYALVLFPTAYSIGMAELAREAEARGFDALYVTEHTHIPVSRRTPFIGGGSHPASADLPPVYRGILNPFVALATAAAVTTKLKVGTDICVVPEHDPIILAKQVASLDVLSGGRFIFGIGTGWNAEEMENHGAPFKDRRKVLREKIEAMKAIWTEHESQYHGQFVNFDPMWCDPKPLQKPYPPILMGGHTVTTMRAVIRYCDGWVPGPSAHIAELIAQFRQMAEEAGRDPKSFRINISFAPSDRARLEKFQELGVERVLLGLPSEGRDEAMRKLEELTALLPA